MSTRSFTQDLTGSNESLEDLLSRLRLQLSRPRAFKGRDLPPDFGHFVTSRRPSGGLGGAEAPITPDRPPVDCHAH